MQANRKSEGIAEDITNAARKLKQMRLDISQIDKATRLNIEEIKQL